MRPFKDKIDPLSIDRRDCYFARVMPGEEPPGMARLADGQECAIASSVPLYYPDTVTGALRPVEIDISESLEPEGRTLREDRNTLGFRIREDGATRYTFAGHVLDMRLVKRAKADSITGVDTEQDISTRAMTQRDGQKVCINYAGDEISVDHILEPGRIKENITIPVMPDMGTERAYRIMFEYRSDTLTPRKIDNEIHWQDSGNDTVLRFPRPETRDANGERIPTVYQIAPTRGLISISVDAAALKAAAAPIIIDPTVDTKNVDITANRSIGENVGGGDTDWEGAYMLFALPSLAGGTATSATINLRCIDASTLTIDVAADKVGAWSESSNESTLEALSFNARTATNQGPTTINTSYAYDVSGAVGVNGVLKAYDDSETDITVRLVRLNGTPAGTDEVTTGILLRDDGSSISLEFSKRTDGTYFPYLSVVYATAGDTGTGAATLDGISCTGTNRGIAASAYHDTVAGLSVYVSSSDLYFNLYLRYLLPTLPAGTKFTGGDFEIYVDSTTGTPQGATFGLDVGAWDNDSTAATLDAFDFKGQLDVRNYTSTGLESVDIANIDGAETGLWRAYENGDTHFSVKIQLDPTESNSTDTDLQLGDPASTPFVDYADASHVDNFPQLIVTYSEAGTCAVTMDVLTAAAVGVVTMTGSGAATLDALTAEALGGGEAEATLQELLASGFGIPTFTGAGAATMEVLTASGGIIFVTGTATATLEVLVAAAIGAKVWTGTGAASINVLTAAAVGPSFAVSGSITNIRRIGTYSWRFDFAGVDPFTVYVDGEATLLDDDATSFDIEDSDYQYESPPLEVRGDLSTSNAEGVDNPPFLILQWRGNPESASYSVREYVDAAYVERFTLVEDGSSYYRQETDTLADVTDHTWRVVPIDAFNNEGTEVDFDIFLVRNPAPPAVTYSYSNATGNLTISARV